MRGIIFYSFLIICIQGLKAQTEPDTLERYIIDNKQNVRNQIAHIKEIYYNFNSNQGLYKKKLLVNPLNNRDVFFLMDPDKLKYIDSETTYDWITIYTYKYDTFCCSLDYFEHYYFNTDNSLVKISCDQGDYPDGFNYGIIDYYYDNEKLIFVFSSWTSNPPTGENSRSIVTEERCYYLDNHPIRCLLKSNKDIDHNINDIENSEIKLIEGLSFLKSGNDLMDKLKKITIKN